MEQAPALGWGTALRRRLSQVVTRAREREPRLADMLRDAEVPEDWRSLPPMPVSEDQVDAPSGESWGDEEAGFPRVKRAARRVFVQQDWDDARYPMEVDGPRRDARRRHLEQRSLDETAFGAAAGGLQDPEGKPLSLSSAEATQLIRSVRWVSDEVMRRLERDPQLLHSLDGRVFEQVLAELFDRKGFDVNLTAATRDGGYDLAIARSSELGSLLYLVEAKRWSKPVGVPVVRALWGEVVHRGATGGLVVTTSRFTQDAISLQRDLHTRLALHDYNVVAAWLSGNGRLLPTSASRWEPVTSGRP